MTGTRITLDELRAAVARAELFQGLTTETTVTETEAGLQLAPWVEEGNEDRVEPYAWGYVETRKTSRADGLAFVLLFDYSTINGRPGEYAIEPHQAQNDTDGAVYVENMDGQRVDVLDADGHHADECDILDACGADLFDRDAARRAVATKYEDEQDELA